MSNEARDWLRQAERDLEAAGLNLRSKQHFVCVFLCQQSAEKALKALNLKKYDELVKTHDLKFLAKKAGAPLEIQMKASFLGPYFVEARYPDYVDTIPAEIYEESDSLQALKIAKEILVWVRKHVEK